MSLSTYYLEYGSHLARLHRRRRRAYAPTSDAASHDNHEKINSWVSFCFPYEYGAPLGGPSGRRSSAIKLDGDTELARAVDVVMARAKIIHILITKVNKLFSFFSSRCFLKEIKEHVLRISIESV